MLSDRARVGILLQGAALLGHLARARWSLSEGFSGARVRAGGLRVSGAVAEPATRSAQSQLLGLVGRLFNTGDTGDEVSGRGQARRVVRCLQGFWRQELVEQRPDSLVTQTLERSPFLWEDKFADARVALLAEHFREGRWTPEIVGPGFLRRRLFAAAASAAELGELLAGSRAGELWRGEGAESLQQLAMTGRWSVAVVRFAGRRRSTASDRRLWAECLYSVGRFEDAYETLRGLDDNAALVQRVACQYQLGRLAAAQRGIRRLAATALNNDLLVEAADVALRVLANRGDRDGVRDWIARLGGARGPRRQRARVLVAYGYWDLGDFDRMAEALDRCVDAAHDPSVATSYHHARGLLAIRRGDADAAVAHTGASLLLGRRRLRRFEAGRLWNDMVLARVLAHDLPGAERACRHSLRLMEACDGPVRTTLGLYNLAEVRIRRGRLRGVRPILEHSSRENRLSRNLRGGAQDSELWARFELARGRAADALERCYEGLDQLTTEGAEWNRAELETLSARALGWLGRREQGRDLLDSIDPRALRILEPEEVAPLLAQCGLEERALEAARSTRVSGLLRALLRGVEIDPHDWEQLEELEPYRASRLVYDLSLLPGSQVPDSVRRRAAAVLRARGAEPLAAALDAERRGPWVALRDYLEQEPTAATAERLLEAVGHSGASISYQPRGGTERRVLVGGDRGVEKDVVETEDGTWVIAAERLDEVSRAVLRLIVQTLPVPRQQRAEGELPRDVVGASEVLLEAWRQLGKLGRGEMPVLLLGETGTGKELAARTVHSVSPRRQSQLLPVNCAALPEALILSDLFGHAKGSFTGADRDRSGIFETARGGAVFLDEIGDLPPTVQGMLLRVLQEGEIRRVGESQPRRVDVRVIAATNQDLEARVRSGHFREDLYYRLNVGTVRLPPLRERGSDIVLLARHFLKLNDPGMRLSAEAKDALLGYSWPGNVRQLQGVIDRAVALAAGETSTLAAEHLDLPGEPASRAPYHEWLDQLKRRRIAEELEICGGNQAAAARRLGLSRQALSYLVRQLRLS